MNVQLQKEIIHYGSKKINWWDQTLEGRYVNVFSIFIIFLINFGFLTWFWIFMLFL
jgi:hypothetical protein